MSQKYDERATELLADRATQGLEKEEWDELRNLLGDSESWGNDDFDLAAAALSLSNLRAVEPLPAHLREKIAQDAFRWFNNNNVSATVSPEAARLAPPATPPRT